MIFQCKASELENKIAKIKEWISGLDNKCENRKRINSITRRSSPPIEVTFSVHEIYPNKMEFCICRKETEILGGGFAGNVLSYKNRQIYMTINEFYSLFETLPNGEIQIEANDYEISLYSV